MRRPRAISSYLTCGFFASALAWSAWTQSWRLSSPQEVPGLKGAVYEPVEWSGSPQFPARPFKPSDIV